MAHHGENVDIIQLLEEIFSQQRNVPETKPSPIAAHNGKRDEVLIHSRDNSSASCPVDPFFPDNMPFLWQADLLEHCKQPHTHSKAENNDSASQTDLNQDSESFSSTDCESKIVPEYLSYLDRVRNTPYPSSGSFCKFCPDRKFHHRYDLVRHIKTSHLKERTFQCHLCPSRFKRRNHRDTHIKAVHEKSMKFVCQYCSKSYTADSTRRKHIRTAHNTTAY
jgi:hypothetical protein